MASFNYTIKEAIDATSFNIKNNTTDVAVQLTLTVTPSLTGITYTKTIAVGAELAAFNSDNGLDISVVSGLSFPLTDDVYTFVLSGAGYDDTTVVMGFYQVIGDAVISESINYRYYMEKYQKDIIIEKVRLLRNLRFSTDTGDLQSFQQNLLQLQNTK